MKLYSILNSSYLDYNMSLKKRPATLCDAIRTASEFGISDDRAVKYCPDNEGTRRNFDALSSTVSCMRADIPINKGWKKDIENYFNSKR